MLLRFIKRLFSRRDSSPVVRTAQEGYTEADRLASFILIGHIDRVNDLLAGYGHRIDITDDEMAVYIKTGKVPLRIAAMAALVRPKLLCNMHTFLSDRVYLNRFALLP